MGLKAVWTLGMMCIIWCGGGDIWCAWLRQGWDGTIIAGCNGVVGVRYKMVNNRAWEVVPKECNDVSLFYFCFS